LFLFCYDYYIFFFSSRRRHTRWPRDWSSDVCSSDLLALFLCVSRQIRFFAGHGLVAFRSGFFARRLVSSPSPASFTPHFNRVRRSEERRVGKEGRSRGAPAQ